MVVISSVCGNWIGTFTIQLFYPQKPEETKFIFIYCGFCISIFIHFLDSRNSKWGETGPQLINKPHLAQSLIGDRNQMWGKTVKGETFDVLCRAKLVCDKLAGGREL